MNELSVTTNKTMSSLDLVKIINDFREEGVAELRHSDFTAKVRTVLGQEEAAKFSSPFKMPSGQTAQGYLLPRREANLMVMSESYKVQAAVYDLMEELQSKNIIPQTYAEALQLAADQAKIIEAQGSKIESDRPKVEFAMTVRNLQGSCSISDFAKAIGTGRNTLYAKFRDDGFLMRNNRPYQKYLDNELFVVVEGIPYTDGNGKTHPAFETRITGKGQVFFEKKYREI